MYDRYNTRKAQTRWARQDAMITYLKCSQPYRAKPSQLIRAAGLKDSPYARGLIRELVEDGDLVPHAFEYPNGVIGRVYSYAWGD